MKKAERKKVKGREKERKERDSIQSTDN